MARIPYPEDVPAELIESQRTDSLPEEYQHLSQGPARNVYRTLAHDTDHIRGVRDFISVTWEHSNLTDRQRELVILSTARAIDAKYEWHQHVRIAILEGVDPEKIQAISEHDLEPFDETESTLVSYARAAARRETTDEDIERLREAFDVETVVGITSLIGSYVYLETALSAFDVETEEPFVGWDLDGLEQE
ncbi:carboxymuconolactone decarboxylase family protein [Natronorubrum sp. FCH18a]|uniref:carboxymuconolactone decarboxylase family protein n=1 Tax=Natronorubrum sp. FCH18a TaxID=3447018 RepID=UPI003F50ED16